MQEIFHVIFPMRSCWRTSLWPRTTTSTTVQMNRTSRTMTCGPLRRRSCPLSHGPHLFSQLLLRERRKGKTIIKLHFPAPQRSTRPFAALSRSCDRVHGLLTTKLLVREIQTHGPLC